MFQRRQQHVPVDGVQLQLVAAPQNKCLHQPRHLLDALLVAEGGAVHLHGQRAAVADAFHIKAGKAFDAGKRAVQPTFRRGRKAAAVGCAGMTAVCGGAHLCGAEDVLHGAAGAGTPDAAHTVGLAIQAGGKGIHQHITHGVGGGVVIAHFGAAQQAVAQRTKPFKIRFQCGQQLLRGTFFLLEHHFADGGKRIRRRGNACAVAAVVVVYGAALRDIQPALRAALQHGGEKDGGLKLRLRIAAHQSVAFGGDTLPRFLQKGLEIRAVFQMLSGDLFDHLGEIHGGDVGPVHALAGDDVLPAGGDGVVGGILRGVTQRRQRRNDDIVVAVLGEAQSLPGQPGGKLQPPDGGIFADAQVDLGVDQVQLQRGVHAGLAQLVITVSAVGGVTAQHQALAVVTRLNALIQIDVEIDADEKGLQRFKQVCRRNAALHIRPVKRQHVLVKPAQTDVGVVVAAQDKNEKFQKHAGVGKGDGGAGMTIDCPNRENR